MEHGDSAKSREKQCNWWCPACGGQNKWRDPNRVLVIQDTAESKGFLGWEEVGRDGYTMRELHDYRRSTKNERPCECGGTTSL